MYRYQRHFNFVALKLLWPVGLPSFTLNSKWTLLELDLAIKLVYKLLWPYKDIGHPWANNVEAFEDSDNGSIIFYKNLAKYQQEHRNSIYTEIY